MLAFLSAVAWARRIPADFFIFDRRRAERNDCAGTLLSGKKRIASQNFAAFCKIGLVAIWWLWSLIECARETRIPK
jgi:hypothetical protein